MQSISQTRESANSVLKIQSKIKGLDTIIDCYTQFRSFYKAKADIILPIIRVRPRDRFYDNYYDGIMTQEERWNIKYEEVKSFIETNKRNPSRHRIEEHDMLNWLKANRKKLNAEMLKEPRLGMFKELLALGEEFKRKNQYE